MSKKAAVSEEQAVNKKQEMTGVVIRKEAKNSVKKYFSPATKQSIKDK